MNVIENNVVKLGDNVDTDQMQHQDNIRIALEEGTIYNEATGDVYTFDPLPDFLRSMIEQVGSIKYALGRKI